MKPLEGRKRRYGDRYDGYYVRNLQPMDKLIPYIMKENADSWVLFEDDLEITGAQDFIYEARKHAIPGLTLYHVIFAAIVRTIAEIPEINRFVKNRRVYARNEIRGSMVVMKGMTKESERSMIIPGFELEDTLKTIVEKIQQEASPIKEKDDVKVKNGFEGLEKVLCSAPNWLLKFAIGMIFFLDNHGWLPKAVHKVSPFHSSFFITNMGSIGIAPVYHHIYELGTISVFIGMGGKETRYETDKDGVVHKHLYVKLRVVVDERATDGFIYAQAFKSIKKYITKPRLLMEPPIAPKHDVID